ncbi:DNA polymerase III subunit delta [Bacillus salitolerans]|uniref:DNA polymerase III subunit delta n=1 Tax=Bacillus salitolerans TaxID=1437434 RepID=A0ABW4LN88_9BACI
MLEIHKKIKAHKFSPVYLLYGKETHFINETITLLLQNVLKEEERDFNSSTYDLEETPLDIALEDAQTIPFFGDKRIIIMKNASFLTGVKEKDKVEHRLELLEKYMASPSPTAIVVIVVYAEKLDERKKLTKLLRKEAEVLEASLSDEKSILQWLENEVNHFDVSITEEASHLLLQYVRNSITLLVHEINKMVMFVGRGGSIDAETVHLLSSKTIEDNIFELIENVMEKKIPEAMHIFQDLLKLNEEPIKIVSLLVSQFRLLYQVKDLSSRGYGQQQIATHLKIHPYRVKLALQKVTGFSFNYLKNNIDELANLDYSMKTGKVDKRLGVELFILKQA